MNTKTAKTKAQSDTQRTVGKRAAITSASRLKTTGKPAKKSSITQSPASKRQKPVSTGKTQPVPTASGVSKQSLIIARLETASGASIAQLVEVTGWQPHSIRGVISGTLRKKLGFEIQSEVCTKTGERLYRILGQDAS